MACITLINISLSKLLKLNNKNLKMAKYKITPVNIKTGNTAPYYVENYENEHDVEKFAQTLSCLFIIALSFCEPPFKGRSRFEAVLYPPIALIYRLHYSSGRFLCL